MANTKMTNIKHFLIEYYVSIFGKKMFYKLNHYMYIVSLHGMGIFNSLNYRISGEDKFLREILLQLASPVVLDVGGNIGAYAKRAREISPAANVFSLEPHPKTFIKLKEAADKYGFRAFNLGLSDASGELKLYDYSDQDGSTHASLHRDIIEKYHHGTAVAHSVFVTTLDEFSAAHNVERIDLLKIDTEGNEFQVLLGAQKLLQEKKIHCIQFEWSELNMVNQKYLKNFMELLPDFSFFRLLPDGLVSLDPYVPIQCEIFGYQNIAAISKK